MKKRLLMILFCMTMFLMLCGFREDENKVFDEGELLSEEEEEKLQELCIETAKEIELDIVVVTTRDLGYKSTMSYADDFYDEGKYGYEYEYGSGVLFLIYEDPYEGEVYISTAGLGILYIDDYDIDTILDAGWDDFAYEYEYYDCLEKMINKTKSVVKSYDHLSGVEEVMDDWYDGEYEDYEDFIVDYVQYGKDPNFFSAFVFCGFISVIISGIFVLVQNSNYKNKMTVSGGTYFRKNSFVMHSNYDNFLRTDVSRVRIESSSSGGGGGGGSRGGSSHRSSSGRSHGGGGRRR